MKTAIDLWLEEAELNEGRIFRAIGKGGRISRSSLSDWAVWAIVQQSAQEIGMKNLGAHDLRRTCAKLCRKSGGDLEQIKFFWATPRFRRPSTTWALSGRLRPRSTTTSAYSSGLADHKALACQQDGFGRDGTEIIGIQNTFNLSKKSFEEAEIATAHANDGGFHLGRQRCIRQSDATRKPVAVQQLLELVLTQWTKLVNEPDA